MKNFVRNVLDRKMLAILLLGFASGLPLALIASVLQAWFTAVGMDIKTIGFLALVGTPYVYKFIWAPVFDRWQIPFLDRRRGWLLTLQLALMAVILFMSFLSPLQHTLLIAGLALCIAVLSASQDTVFDAYRTDVLNVSERGLGSSYMVAGYRVALLVAGGLGLIMAQVLGWATMYRIMGCLMGIGVLGTFIAPRVAQAVAPPKTLVQAVIKPFKAFSTRFGIRYVALILIMVVLYKISDAAVLSLNTTFLMRTGFSLIDIGTINKGAGFIATLLGTFVGGLLMARLSLYRALFGFGILQVASNIFYLLLAWVGKHYALMIAAIVAENFCSGMGTVAFLAFLMSLCDIEFSATQFALLSAFSSVGRVIMGPIAGILVSEIGWVDFYIWTMVVGMPGLILLWWMRDSIIFDDAALPRMYSPIIEQPVEG